MCEMADIQEEQENSGFENESFYIDRMFSDYVVIDEDFLQPAYEEHNSQSQSSIPKTILQLSTENNNIDTTQETEDDSGVHPELESIFMNFEEFSTSSSPTLKQIAVDEEDGFLYMARNPAEDDDDYLRHCNVCLDFQMDVAYCILCSTSICFSCLGQYIEHNAMDGIIEFCCPSDDNCAKIFSEQLVGAFVKPETFAILTKNKIDADKNPNTKTCPGCHKVTKRESVQKSQKGQETSKITCSCGMFWCFSCYSPWHTGISCKTYQKDAIAGGKKALRFWAKVGKKGKKNARKCPKCKIFIERTAGCDHMSCKRCNTDFCYRCGRKHFDMGWIGNHYSTYSFLGCKYNLHPTKPALRIFKRSGVIVGGVLLAPIALGGLTITAVAAAVVVPGILVYRKCCK